MYPLTFQDVLAHQAMVPWPQLHQVEQDLLLCLAMRWSSPESVDRYQSSVALNSS